MRLSTKTRYGLRLMFSLGLHFDRTTIIDLGSIAKEEDISGKYLEQIISPLKAAGLVRSTRGIHGGYRLARDPSEISLKQIVETLEGDLSLVECVKNKNACSRITKCVTQEVWNRLSAEISAVLSSISIHDLVEMHKKKIHRSTVDMYYI